jgi:hypothetical protein
VRSAERLSLALLLQRSLDISVTKHDVEKALFESKSAIENIIRSAIEQEGRIASRLDQILITLSTGSVVFPIAFVKELSPHPRWLPLLFLSWIAFLVCIAFVINAIQEAHQFARDVAVKRSDDVRKLISETNRVSKLSDVDFQQFLGDRSYASFLTTVTARESEAVKKRNLVASLAFAMGLLFLLLFVGLNLCIP